MISDGTSKVGTSLSASRIIRPLITKEKSPSVRRLTGIDTSIQRGLIVWLIPASTSAVMSPTHAVERESASVEKKRGTPTRVI